MDQLPAGRMPHRGNSTIYTWDRETWGRSCSFLVIPIEFLRWPRPGTAPKR